MQYCGDCSTALTHPTGQIFQLLFTHLVSNGKILNFSILKVDKQGSLGNHTLNDSLSLNTDSNCLKDFDPNSSIQLWWYVKPRKQDQENKGNM